MIISLMGVTKLTDENKETKDVKKINEEDVSKAKKKGGIFGDPILVIE